MSFSLLFLHRQFTAHLGNVATQGQHLSQTLLNAPILSPPQVNYMQDPFSLAAVQWHSGMSPHHYEIVFLPNNVKKCYGCGNEFADKYRAAPFNTIVKHRRKNPIFAGHAYISRETYERLDDRPTA